MSAKPAIFISYRRTDTRWFAAALRSRIAQHLPQIEVFLDVASLEPGLDFVTALASTLDRSAVVLVLIGNSWLTAQDQGGRRRLDLDNDWVRLEVARALDRDVPVIPVLVDGAAMPSEEFLPAPLLGLSRRQTLSVRFEDQDVGLETILRAISKAIGSPPAQMPEHAASTMPETQPSATAVMDVFEEGSTDNSTLSVLAGHQLNSGRFALAKAVFEVIASRMLRLDVRSGPPQIDTLRAMYQVARAELLLGETQTAASRLESLLPGIERERDESYPLYMRVQAALARAHLERGQIDAARRVLPRTRGALFSDQSLTALDAWIAHLEGQAAIRDCLLAQLDAELATHPPEAEFARSVSRLRETMLQGSSAPTMAWTPDHL